MPVVKTCVICEKTFSVPPCRSEKAKACSSECRGKLIAQAYQDQRVAHRCKWCDAEFFSPKCHAHRRTYCSVSCAHKANVGNYAGPLSEDGGVSGHSDGYVLEREREHPFAVRGMVLQHRLVMERWMREAAPDHHFLEVVDGEKYLRREIHVHHHNEIKDDNDRENLLACTAATHKDAHAGRPIMRGTAWPESGDEVQAEPRSFVNKCLICKAKFKAKRANVLRGGGKYCSRKCRDIAATGKKQPTK